VKKLLLISSIILLFTHFLHGQNPFITNYTLADGLPTNKFYCVLQDKEGFLWFGTDAGAIRYDGTRFERFMTDDGLSDNKIFRMFEDFEGRIWFLNSDGSVNYIFNHHIFNKNNKSFLGEIKTNFFFHGVFQDIDSTLYFYNNSGEIYAVKDTSYIDYISLPSTNSGLLNINKTSDNHFLFWRKNQVVKLETINNTINTYNLDFTCNHAYSQDSYTYACDEMGNVHLFHDETLIKKDLISVGSKIINDIKIDNGYIWISTFDKGLFCYKGNDLVQELDIAKSQNIFFDNQNYIWTVSNIYGGFKINKDILKYKTIGIEEFDNLGLNDIAPSTNGGLWITNGKSLYWFDTDKKEVFSRKLSIGGLILDNINQLKDNTIIINGTSTNINIINNVEVNERKDLLEYGKRFRIQYAVKKIVIDPNENFIYSFLNNQLFINNIRNNYKADVKDYNQGRIRNIFIDSNDELVINASKNFVRTPDTTYRNPVYTQFDGNLISSHLIIDQKFDLLNINGKQLQLLNDDRKFNLLQGIDDQIDFKIEDMIYYGKTLFFFTVKTVFFISNPTGVFEDKPIKLNRLNIEFNNIKDIYCQDDNLYVASDNGLTIIPVEECVNSEPIPTKPYFSKILLDDKEADLNDGKLVYKNKDRLNIEFSSLNFSSSPSNYAYMLEGVNADWIAGTERQVVYLNLKPGHYTFKLKSRKNLEAYSEVIELPIEVVPTFFQLIITKIVAVLVLLFIGFLIVRNYYHRQIKIREKDIQLVTLENRALQSMMNPHFIFNSLGSIQKFLLQNKSEEAGSYLSQFARLIRQTMNSIKSNFVTLDDEIDRLRNYIELEQFRMESRFDYTIETDSELEQDDYNIPSMIIQPFVENAIWHGISQLQEKGFIRIHFSYVDEKIILIVIEDNGIGFEKSKVFSKSKDNMNMASSINNKRIQLLGEKYKVKTNLVIEELYPGKENPGARISLFVPIIN